MLTDLSPAERRELEQSLVAAAPAFSRQLAALTFERGLAVTDPRDGRRTPIPVTATPVIIGDEELSRRQRLAAHITSATVKLARWALLDARAREWLLGSLSPLERTLAEATFQRLTTLVSNRVDFFVSDRPRALEVNATIPAMQGYSDIAAATFLEVVGKYLGVEDEQVRAWQLRNGSNTLALFQALVAGYRQLRPDQDPRSIALLCRRHDAQVTELEYLARRWRELGVEALVAHPDQLALVGPGVEVDGRPVDLVYRHIFVRRLESGELPGADVVRTLLLAPGGAHGVVLNPPSTQVEVKGVFALVSLAGEDGALASAAGLDADEVEAIRAGVPWTRRLEPALLEQVKAEPHRYVLKRSWDYGGRAVFVGSTVGTPAFTDRVVAAYGEPLPWPRLVDRAAADPAGGGFVVQEVVRTLPVSHLLCSADGEVTPADLYVDFSAYASVGLPGQPPWGGVCRGSVSRVVNIVGGGGVVPLITGSVARSVLEAFRGMK